MCHKNILGSMIRDLRKARGFKSHAALSKACQGRPSAYTIGEIERGKKRRKPRASSLKRLAEALNVPYETLLNACECDVCECAASDQAGLRERTRVDELLDEAVAAEEREAQAKERHRQLEDQCNAKRRELQALRGEGQEAQAERDRVTAELAELRRQARAVCEEKQAAVKARDQARLAEAEARKRAEDAEQAARAAREQRVAPALLILLKTSDDGNAYGFECIEVLQFNYDGRGSALVRMDGELDSLHPNDLVYVLHGDEDGVRWYRPVWQSPDLPDSASPL